MSDGVYEGLREHLNGLPVGFSRTDSRVEIDILKKIFDPEEAQMAKRLQPFPETLDAFCQRTGIEQKTAGAILERMAKKGQIFRMRREGKIHYSAAVFIPGIWEYQLNNLDHELAELVERYYEEAMVKDFSACKIPIFRVLPVDEKISTELEVMPYDRVKKLVRSQKTIALTNCICRKERRLTGYDCNHIDDVCLLFSHMARYYVENGLARFITVDEAIDALDRAERDGLVHSPQNSQRPMGLCNCCGCCCMILRGITQLKIPASKVVRSDFYCVCESESCTGCGECTDRCHVHAINLEDEVARIDHNQCIGCGLCVSACPTEALELVHKPAEELPALPTSVGEIFSQLASERARNKQVMKR